jgi:hypothetical protein
MTAPLASERLTTLGRAALHRLPNSLDIGKVIPFRRYMANDSGGERPNSGKAHSIGFAARSEREESDGE